jgi:hypothetical protein
MELSPRLFSNRADLGIQPEMLKEDRYRNFAVPVFKARSMQCELTGLKLAGDPESMEHGALRLEWRDPKAEKKTLNSKSVRVLDGQVYWARHIDQALEQDAGTLIFAPWLDQKWILALFRMAMIVKSDPSAKEIESADAILGIFHNLRQSELMVTALGLDGEVDGWDAKQWLEGIKDLPIKQRKAYIMRFGKHVRYLPSVTACKPLTKIWRQTWGLPESGKTDHWQAETVKWYQKVIATV